MQKGNFLFHKVNFNWQIIIVYLYGSQSGVSAHLYVVYWSTQDVELPLIWKASLNSGPHTCQACISTTSATLPALFGYFQHRVLWTVCLGWLWTLILLISASWIARIIGVSHQVPGDHFFVKRTFKILSFSYFELYDKILSIITLLCKKQSLPITLVTTL
jgi:hypothetical protein